MRLDELTSDDLDWIASVLESWSRTQRWSLLSTSADLLYSVYDPESGEVEVSSIGTLP